jgi:hypothetical protein
MDTAGTLDEEALLEGLLEDGEEPAAAASGRLPKQQLEEGEEPGEVADAAAAVAAENGGGEGGNESDGGGAEELTLAELEAAADAAAARGFGGGGAAEAAPVSTYKAVLKSPALEVKLTVWLFRCYPLVPPRWAVDRIGAVGAGGKKGEALALPNERIWLEREVRGERGLAWLPCYSACDCGKQLSLLIDGFHQRKGEKATNAPPTHRPCAGQRRGARVGPLRRLPPAAAGRPAAAPALGDRPFGRQAVRAGGGRGRGGRGGRRPDGAAPGAAAAAGPRAAGGAGDALIAGPTGRRGMQGLYAVVYVCGYGR